MANWTHPICEACWIIDSATFEEHDGMEVMTAIRMPVMMTGEHRQLEQCCVCGNPTIVGIYVRKDPTSVPFPKVENDDT